MIKKDLGHQPIQWTLPTGSLNYPSYIWVDFPTSDVTKDQILTCLVRADQHHNQIGTL